MLPISQKYRNIARELVKRSSHTSVVTEADVYQEGNPGSRRLVDEIVADLLLPGSRVMRLEHLEQLHTLSTRGKSCLILMEHYSNFDIPCLYYLAAKAGDAGRRITDSIVSIAGMKLNEQSKFVLAFSECYTRIVIYPSRALAGISEPEKLQAERRKSNTINRAALHEMVRRKHSGHMILVFPSGTRYRPGVESTKRGLKEVDSYIKSFDYMVFVGIAGNILRVNPNEEMSEDLVAKDAVIFTVGPVTECQDFRQGVRDAARTDVEQDLKQVVADRVMAELSALHAEAEELRAPLSETPR